MLYLKFHSKKLNQSTAVYVDETSITMDELMTKIKTHYGVTIDRVIHIYCISKEIKPIYFKTDEDIKDMIRISKANEIRYFEVFWKQIDHGKQELDMSDTELGKTLVGYKRYVNADVNAEGVMVGDPNGVNVFIPSGALKSNATVSVKTVAVSENNAIFDGLRELGFKNVTAHVQNDPNKVNKKMNN